MIASLPMYWRDENAQIWQQYWQRIQQALGVNTQSALIDPNDITDLFAHWLDPNLTLSMTCGLPLRTRLKDKVSYVGTLDFGTTPTAGHYWSVAIAKRNLGDEKGDLRMAYNMEDSQSGWAASFDPKFADLKSRVTQNVPSGGHAASFDLIMRGDADFAFLDSVTWQLLRRFDHRTNDAVVLGTTSPTPALPFITSLDNDVESLRTAIAQATDGFSTADAELIGGFPKFEVLSTQEYYAVPLPPAVQSPLP